MNWSDVSLKKVTKDDLELVRIWRNDNKISQYMSFRDHITSEQQLEWFKSISNNENFYYIIVVGGTKVGLYNIKNIDEANKCGELGMFIFEDQFLNSIVPYIVFYMGGDIHFYQHDLDYVYAHILKDNKRAIRFNKSLGYKLDPEQEEITNQRYTLTREDYEENKKRIMKILDKTFAQ